MKNPLLYTSYFLLGIKGVAMTNIAIILQQMGKKVSGIDTREEFITDVLLKNNNIVYGTNINTVLKKQPLDVYIYSAAHKGSENPIIKKALRDGKFVISQAEFIEKIRELFPTSIAVSGCHGKTTTTSLLAYSLIKLKAQPSFIVGTSLLQDIYGGNYQQDSRYFVFEADEYGIQPPKDKRSKLLMYHPQFIICTNIDFDHPDVYENIEEVKRTFLTFFSDRKLFLCSDDPHIQSVLPKLDRRQYKTYGFSDSSDLVLVPLSSDELHTTFSAQYHGKDLGVFSIRLFGDKNISNVGGVILCLLELGFNIDEIKKTIRSFSSVKRRFELIYKKNGILLFDDYAHHPAEIEATIQAIKQRFKSKRIVVIFQPHTFSRTESLKTAIITALSKADIAYMAPIFPSARENRSDFTINTNVLKKVAKTIGISNVIICDTKRDIINQLPFQLHSNDVVVTMGAGDIYKLKDDIISIIDSHAK